MINSIKSRINRFVDKKIALLRQQQLLNQQTDFNYNQISQLFKEDSFIPFSAWALSPNIILHILNDICLNKRKKIIEFGSGASTFYIAKLIKTLQLDAVFYSIESNKEWAEELERQLQIYHLEEFAHIVYSPLKEVKMKLAFKNQERWYDEDLLKHLFITDGKFDLVIVDGPFGGSTPYARFSAIPFLKNELAENYSIFLDDANRMMEREIAKEWQILLQSELEFIERYAVLTSSQNFDAKPFQLSNHI